jgi:hypothetical protein
MKPLTKVEARDSKEFVIFEILCAIHPENLSTK